LVKLDKFAQVWRRVHGIGLSAVRGPSQASASLRAFSTDSHQHRTGPSAANRAPLPVHL